MDNSLAVMPTNNIQLARALGGLEESLFQAARANVAQVGEGFTDLEIHSMTVIEELKLINGLDLAAVLLRGKLLKEIEEQALWTSHPGGYETLESMAQDQGISISELSNIRDLTQIIFPWMEQNGFSVADQWERVGKSKFREMTPVLKALITGNAPDTTSARNSMENLLNDVAATAEASDQTLSEEELRTHAAVNLIEIGGQMTNRQLREHIRPERTRSIEPLVIEIDGTRYMLSQVDEDQWTMLQRRLNGYMNPVALNLPADRCQRQVELARIPVLRRLVNLLEG